MFVDDNCYDIGEMNVARSKYNALHFAVDEVVNSSRKSPQFFECCKKMVGWLRETNP